MNMATFKSKRNPGKTIKAGKKAAERLRKQGFEEANKKQDESKQS